MAPLNTLSTRPDPESDADAAHHARFALLFATIVVTSLAGLVVALRFPAGADGFTYATVARDPRALWWFLLAAGVNLAVGVTALALAGMSLTHRRGAVWATAGGALMWLGAGVYAVGLGNWAGVFASATHHALDGPVSRGLVDAVIADAALMWTSPGAGAGLVAIGTVLLSVGLWRAGSVPRWVPTVAAVGIVASFLVPTSGVVGLVVEGPIAASSVAIGWYAWRGLGVGERAEAGPARGRRARLPVQRRHPHAVGALLALGLVTAACASGPSDPSGSEEAGGERVEVGGEAVTRSASVHLQRR